MSLLIGLPFNQLSSVSSVSAGIENIGGVYVESEGVRWICAFGPLDVWATVASGAVDGLDEHAIGGVYADGSDVGSCCGSRLICLPSSLETWAADASCAVDGFDEHAANANATAAPMIVPVIDLVMVFMFFSFFKNKSYNESE